MSESKPKRSPLTKATLLSFVVFYVFSYGPAVYLFTATGADKAWPVTLPPFGFFYFPHIVLHQHTRLYYTYSEWWAKLAAPDRTMTTWDELQAIRKERKALSMTVVPLRYQCEIHVTSGEPVSDARITVQYSSHANVYWADEHGVVSYQMDPSATLHQVEVFSQKSGSAIFFTIPLPARITLDGTRWQQRAKEQAQP